MILVVKLLFELGDNILEFEGRHRFFPVEPKLLHQLGESNGELALRPQRIVVVDLLFEVAAQEVLR